MKTWLVVAEPASVYQEFGSVTSVALVSTCQPVWSAGQVSCKVPFEKRVDISTGLRATDEVMANMPVAGAHCQLKPLGSGGRFVEMNEPMVLEALKIWKVSPAHNWPSMFVTISEPP